MKGYKIYTATEKESQTHLYTINHEKATQMVNDLIKEIIDSPCNILLGESDFDEEVKLFKKFELVTPTGKVIRELINVTYPVITFRKLKTNETVSRIPHLRKNLLTHQDTLSYTEVRLEEINIEE